MIIKSNSSFFFFQILFCIFPFLLISGPFLPDLFISILSFFFLIYCVIKKKFFFFKKKIIILFLIFYLYLNLNSFFSFDPLISFSVTLPYIRMILFSIFLAYLLSNIFNLKKIIFFSFFISYLVLLCDSFLQLSTGYNILGYPIIQFRISSFFNDKLIMGSYVSRVLPILLAITYSVNLKYSDLLRFLCISIAGILVYLSAERVSSFFYIFTVAVYIILLPNKKEIFIKVCLLFLLFTIIFFIKPSSANKIYQFSLEQIFEKQTGNKNKFNIFSYRHEMHYLTAYKMFKDRILIGQGVKSYRYLCDDVRYNVKNKIIEDNKIFAPIDGYFIILSAELTKLYLIPANIKNEFISKLEEFEIRKLIQTDINADKILDDFYEKNLIYKYTISKQNLLFINSKDSSYVKKGDYLFSSNDFSNGCNTHPHNVHLQVLSETGLVGYFFLFFFIIYLAHKFFREIIKTIFTKKINNQKKDNLCFLFILSALIQVLFPFIPSGNAFNNWISVTFYFQLAFLFNYLYFNKNKTQ